MHRRRSLVLLLYCIAVLLGCKLKGLGPAGGASTTSSAAQGAAAAAPSDYAFRPKIPSAGTSSTVTRSVALMLGMGNQSYRQNSFDKFKLTVKAADDFRITKALIEVQEKYETKQDGNAAEKKTVSPLAGGKFVVSRDDAGKVSAVDGEGAAVSAAQVKLLGEDYADLLKKDTLGSFLPDHPIKLGEKLSPSASSLMQMLDIKDDGKTTLDGIEFVFTSMDTGSAHFSMAFTLTMGLAGGLRMRAKLSGQLTVQTATVWLVGASLSGPVIVLDGKGNEKGKGDMKFTADQTFG
jgi:hypothetical protein